MCLSVLLSKKQLQTDILHLDFQPIFPPKCFFFHLAEVGVIFFFDRHLQRISSSVAHVLEIKLFLRQLAGRHLLTARCVPALALPIYTRSPSADYKDIFLCLVFKRKIRDFFFFLFF